MENPILDKRNWQRVYFSQDDFDALFEQALQGSYLTTRNSAHDAIRDMILAELLERESGKQSG